MKKHFILAALLFAALATAAVFAIVGGELDKERHPNVGAIVYRWVDGNLYPWASGTLIDNKAFLTAGHVTNGINNAIAQGALKLEDIFICFDSENTLSSTANLRPVSAIVTHPNFRSYTENWYDVGLIILQDEITDITPAQLATPGLLDQLKAGHELSSGPKGTRFVCVGYGSFLEFPPPRIVWENKDRYMAKSGYLGLKKDWLILTMNGPSGYGGTGYGDSGGPNFWIDEGGNEILVALTSKGDPKLVATSICYRVDNPEILGFIQGVIATAN